MKLGRSHSTRPLGALDDVLHSGPEDSFVHVDVRLSKIDPSMPNVRLRVADLIAHRLELLEHQLDEHDFTRLTATKRIEQRRLGDAVFYKTDSSLSVYFHVVDASRSDLEERNILLLLGYGEYQPMRYLVTIVSVHELESAPPTVSA